MIRFIFILILNGIFFGEIFSQEYQSRPFITLEGDNYDINVLSPLEGFYPSPTYICWVNHRDSIYTVYLKQVSPVISENIIIVSDSTRKSNPQITNSRIAWENMKDGYWQIWYAPINFDENTIDSIALFADSLQSKPQITLSNNHIGWIQNGKLLICNYRENPDTADIVDDTLCSSPDLIRYDYSNYSQVYTNVIYEKNNQGISEIYLAELNTSQSPQWNKVKISAGPAVNPRHGLSDKISFQFMQDSLWSIINGFYYDLFLYNSDTVKIADCNLRNPQFFLYNMPTKSGSKYTFPFCVFEKDSVGTDNSEIVIKTTTDSYQDTFITISKTQGIIAHPNVAYLNYRDSVKIAIFWINKNPKKDIWIAETFFNPKLSAINNKLHSAATFKLNQNYPNPFNPSTTISYSLSSSSKVRLSIYDVTGRLISVPIDKKQSAGSYTVNFDASNLASGIYIYVLKSGSRISRKKMLLLR